MDTSSDKQQEQRLGHRRQPALGKAMPVTALLLNLNLAQSNRPSHARSAPAGALDEDEPPPRYFSIAEELQQPPSPSENKAAEPALLGAGKPDVPCLNCCQRAPLELSGPGLAINEMCQRLCSDECRRGLSLTGCLATQDAEQLRQDFLKQYEIAEALAKTSAMTSTTQMKQRLAARKLEMDIETQAAAASTEPAWLTTPSDKAATTTAAAAAGVVVAAAAAAGDTLPPIADNEQPPPRDLLLYLVRMGSFNSAPKINNVDSQDDGLELPKGLSTDALLDHVRQLHGSGVVKPSLLSRCFLKPPLNSDDVTDGLRCLQLNSVSRVCSAPSDGAQHIRLLQWNILSQTLGQHNDGFVRCPDEALTWQHRRYLIVQEILQNQPDVVCLQEVDHFKFLQTVLGSQNYDGIFFPKPDSPCLYIEENNGPDGCAIFYKRDKLQLLGYDTRILEVWRVQSNQVAIAARLQLKASGREFCVCTTHLKARHGALLAKLRNEQGRDLIRFVKQFAGESPLLLCGDFNAEPIEPIYATILSCDLFKLGSAYADIKLEREREREREDQEQHTASCDDPNELIAQSIKREPPYTTWKIREDGEECHTIDYVFYTPQQLKIKNCLEFPAGEQIGKNRTPCFEYPSDHFSLVCDFELLDAPLSEDKSKPHGTIQ
ncbi:nocturnin isoform X2 [Drosophila mojavensis]|uniref:nocturnin isoform X2 n=1 Tax=Drosophila mojavensis TaxID=7230 RepID=UPI001CD0C32F|nr:nocturnin isoform X2 [Drosophila mojavensis]